jgi:Uncharacterized conserved protein
MLACAGALYPGRGPRLFRGAILLLCLCLCRATWGFAAEDLVLRVYDWKTGVHYVEVPARVNGTLFFGWMHSLEHIPWHEQYRIAENRTLILDSIAFPAFGAGIPENKGTRCYVKDGMIHMENIQQVFHELDWINSHYATRQITLDGVPVSSGAELPQHTRLRLVIERR